MVLISTEHGKLASLWQLFEDQVETVVEQVEAILFNELLHVFAHALRSLLSSFQCLVLTFLAGLPDHIAQRDVEQLK